ncbi:MAG: dihydrodipicolinate reductase [Planctomycetes bacterium]|nr:dihydrodipicolinate reductase [Planctomycetota bacterium]
MAATPLVLVGLGPIGRATLARALERRGLAVVGACDADPALAGARLSDLVAGAPRSVRVVSAIGDWKALPKGTVAVVCTSSQLAAAAPTFRALLAKRIAVVSSCEELTWPWRRSPRLARELDALARRKKVALLGTGVNPGYVLDLLPAVLTGPCLAVRAVRAHRVVDAALRRGPLQRKVGAGRTVAEFTTEARAGRLGHVGLPESAELLCAALGFGRPRIVEELLPKVATRPIATDHVRVEPGQVAGIDHRLVATAPRGVVELHLEMYVGAEAPRDEVEIDGDPPIRARLDGGTPGDLATVAALLNAAPAMAAAAPGLRSVLDGPFPLCRARG